MAPKPKYTQVLEKILCSTVFKHHETYIGTIVPLEVNQNQTIDNHNHLEIAGR